MKLECAGKLAFGCSCLQSNCRECWIRLGLSHCLQRGRGGTTPCYGAELGGSSVTVKLMKDMTSEVHI